MSLCFKGGERLQCGRGIGGLLNLVKSLFTRKGAGKGIIKAATSNTGKAVLNSIKDQAIDSGIRLASDALRGEDMDESLHNELQTVKRKAADGLESVVRKNKKRTTKQNDFRGLNIDKQSLSHPKNIKQKRTKYNQPKRRIIKKKKDFFDDDE